jgi:WD40 repeat protein
MVALRGRLVRSVLLRAGACFVGVSAGLLAASPAVGTQLSGQQPERQLFTFLDERIAESSGLATTPQRDLVFTIEDAGNGPIIWGVNLEGQVRVREQVVGTTNVDWEDLARGTDDEGGPALFVADTGDGYFRARPPSGGPRKTFRIVRVSLPVPPKDNKITTPPAKHPVFWDFAYPDGRNHNSEAMLVEPRTNQVFLIDKPVETDAPTSLWRLPARPRVRAMNTLTRVAEVPVSRATGAAFSPDGRRFVVRNSQFAYVWDVVRGSVAASLATAPTIVVLPHQRQGEGVTFTPDGNALLLSSEGSRTPVWVVPLKPIPPVSTSATASKASRSDASVLPSQVALMTGAAVALVGLIFVTIALRRRRRNDLIDASFYEFDIESPMSSKHPR